VRYSGLYPGIDLVFYGNNRQLEYDMVVSPGADPGQIRLGISGCDNLRIDANGNLVLKTASGDVIQQKPKVYQRKAGRLVAVAGHYVINNKNEVGFRLDRFDRKSAVIIDPVLRFSSYLTGGGDEPENGTGIVVDSSNRAVVSGWTASLEFPAGSGIETPMVSSSVAFVIKFDYTGSRMVFVAFVPGCQFDDNIPLVLDAAGNIYVAGSTFGNTYGSDTFSATAGAFQTTFGGATDAWVAKLNSTGTKLFYATFLGGSGDESVGGIRVDASGNAYVTGSTTSKNFPVTPGAFQGDCKLKSDGSCASAFVTKLNADGSLALYSSYLGGHGSQTARGIALNSGGNAFVVGGTDAKDFPTTAGTQQTANAGGQDAFVAEFSSSGSHLNYSTLLGGSGADLGRAIALDPLGNPYITGRTESTDFPVKNAYQSRCPSQGCVFVTKLNSSLRLLYSTILGAGSYIGDVGGTGIAVTSGGQAYVTGNPGPNFPISQNAFQRIQLSSCGNPPGGAIFITKLTASGQLSYSSYFGSSMRNSRVALDGSTNAYLTGDLGYCGTIPVTPGAFQQERGAEGDAFFAKVVSLCALSTLNRSVTICSPSSGSTVASPLRITAGTTDVTPVRLMQIYVDGKKIYETPLSAISVNLPIGAGTHRLTVQAFDTANAIFKKSITITIH
ncbi:MAG TPA: SBBP repeat-containing protein, partial [Candidatus Angelobacter sp.]|nr:SBBP repeat-containing protein [Candidatus Angelobacter sp.]